MTLVMSYVILLSAGVGACAAALEAVMRGRRVGTRGIWILAMGTTMGTTLFAMVAPKAATDVVVETAPVMSNIPTLSPSESAIQAVADGPAFDRLQAAVDSSLPVAWLSATLLLLVALGLGRWRYRRERTTARPITIGGHDVLLTENVGPAVAGIRQPVVFVPRWVLALDEGTQQLLLAHEAEHVKNRDTSLLLFGALTAALTPWNPVVWWMVRRLRLTVEQDCDARVLARYPEVRRYADLLLMAASRPRLTTRLLAAHFGEDTSDLLRRIDAMTSRKIPLRTLVASAAAAVALLVAACETPRPEPVAPLPIREAAPLKLADESAPRSTEFSEQVVRCTRDGGAGCQISVIVQSSDLKTLARYNGEIPVSHLPEGWVDKIKVEEATCGNNSCSLIWITLKPGRMILKSKARPDEIERKIFASRDTSRSEAKAVVRPSQGAEYVELKKAVEQYHLPSKSPNQDDGVRAMLIERDGNREARGQGMVSWPAWTNTEVSNVVVLSADRTELRRYLADDVQKSSANVFDQIAPADVAALEIHTGKTGCAPLSCPLVKVIIKPGREAAYKR